jgi:dTDP-4-dehydrorhamnose reductase
MNKPRILVTGANGQLGKELKELRNDFPAFEFVFFSRADLPIHHYALVNNTFTTLQPQFCINCAAYTNVDRAEQEKELAFHINAEAAGKLASVCRKNNSRFIHISTDYVFDGRTNIPYSEEAAPHPLNIYGASKLAGEKEVMKENPAAIILRSSWIYSPYGKNFVKTMLQLMERNNEISVVSDQSGSPTYAANLAGAILQIISSGRWLPGIYHYCNEGIISWYDFAIAIREITGRHCKIHAIPSSQYPTAAVRPAFSALSCVKIQQAYGIPLQPWKNSLIHCLQKLKATEGNRSERKKN